MIEIFTKIIYFALDSTLTKHYALILMLQNIHILDINHILKDMASPNLIIVSWH